MRISIRTKLLGAVIGGLLVVAAATAVLMRIVYERAVRLAAEDSIRNAAAAFANLEKNESDKLAVGLSAIAANPELQRRFLARDRAGLLAASEPLFAALRDRGRVTRWYFVLPDRTVLLRVHLPALHGDRMDRGSLLRAIETGELAIGKDLGKTAFALRAVLPWRVEGRIIGYLELGEDIDDFLASMKAQRGDELALFLDKQYVDSRDWAEQRARRGERNNWDDRSRFVLVRATVADGWPDLTRVAHDLSFTGEAVTEMNGLVKDRVVGVFPTLDANGHGVGLVAVSHRTGAVRAGLVKVRAEVVLAVVLLAAAFAALIIFLLDTLVFARLRRMSALFEQLPERMARGDYRVEDEIEVPADDELGEFEVLFQRAVEVIRGALREVEQARDPRDRPPGH